MLSVCSDGRDGLVVSDLPGTLICHFLIQDGLTSLMWASDKGHVECVKMLLEGGAQANQQNNVSGYRLVQCLVGDVYLCDMCGLWQ